MRSTRRLWLGIVALPALVGLLADSAAAGTNEGFSASISGDTVVTDPAVGQAVTFSIEMADIVSAYAAYLELVYDPAVVSVENVEAGDFFPQPFIVLTDPELPYPGQLEYVRAGGAQLGARTRASGDGRALTVTCKIIGKVPEEGSFISVVGVHANLSTTDKDSLEFVPGQFGIALTRTFPNHTHGFYVHRQQDSAKITWYTRFAGVEDVVRYWAVGTSDTLVAHNSLADAATEQVLADVQALRAAGIDLQFADTTEVATILGREITLEEMATLRLVSSTLASHQHVALLDGLTPDTEYAFQARSVSLSGAESPLFSGEFVTRDQPDLRPVVISQVNIERGTEGALVVWKTNRPADTRILVTELDEGSGVVDTVLAYTTDQTGTLGHIVRVRDLSVGTLYQVTVGSRLPNAQSLMDEGLLTAEQVEVQQTYSLSTSTQDPLRFLELPRGFAAIERALIRTRLNQPAWVVLEYGEVADPAGKITAATQIDADEVYPEKLSSSEPMSVHEFRLSGLRPGTVYRYRVTAYLDGTPKWQEGDPLNTPHRISTDPRGERQWSRDMRFKTSLGPPQPPVITDGPQCFGHGRNPVIWWTTDVPTTGSVHLGTWQGESMTLGTGDEWEYPDLDEYGRLRFVCRHVVTLPSLDLVTRYGFRVESVALNELNVVFDPLNSLSAAGRAAKLAQPPGGAGTFTTESTPDTQWPVLLSGPTVSSKTHDTAFIEWSTDEPADSQVRFGTEELDQEHSSTVHDVQHKMVITNLEIGTTYDYISGSTDPSGNGPTESSPATFTTNPEVDVTPPEIVEGPEVVYKNESSATIEWTTDEAATEEVEFGTTENLGILRSSWEMGLRHHITLTNLEADAQYLFRVSSFDFTGNGPTTSEMLSFTTDSEADRTPPVISSVAALVADSSAIITWETDKLANSYVEFGTDSLDLNLNVGSVESVLQHEIVLTGLNPATTCYYRVGSVDRARNAAVESAIDSFTTTAEADTTPPTVPTHLTARGAHQQVLLRWDALPELDLNGFNLYRRTGADPFVRVASGIRNNEYMDLNVTNSTTYEYQVTAIDRRNPPNESSPSDCASATPTASAAPSFPGTLIRTGMGSVRPTFVFTNSTPLMEGATLTYTIQVATDPAFRNVVASVANLPEGSGGAGSGKTAWTINRDLVEGHTYYWRVRAVEGDLLGPYSVSEPFTAQEAPDLPGDFNLDGSVDFLDFFKFVGAFGQPAIGEFAKYDLWPDGTIEFRDFFRFVGNFGATASKSWAGAVEVDETAAVSMDAISGTTAEDRNTISVRVRADNVRQLESFGFILHYDPYLVEWVEASPGPGHVLTSRGGDAPLFRVLYERPGELLVGNGIVEGDPVSGYGLLSEMKFRVLGSPSKATFSLEEVLFASSSQDVRRVGQLPSVNVRPQSFYLGTNYPNPFNPSTSIEYGLPETCPLELTVFDILGQRIRTLARSEAQPAGFYTVRWDGRDDLGRNVGSGLYFYRLHTPEFTRTQKMTVIK